MLELTSPLEWHQLFVHGDVYVRVEKEGKPLSPLLPQVPDQGKPVLPQTSRSLQFVIKAESTVDVMEPAA